MDVTSSTFSDVPTLSREMRHSLALQTLDAFLLLERAKRCSSDRVTIIMHVYTAERRFNKATSTYRTFVNLFSDYFKVEEEEEEE